MKLLFEAVMRGDTSEIASLTRQVSPEGLRHVKDGNGRNALHFAAHAGQVPTVLSLLEEEGMDVNAQDEAGGCHQSHTLPSLVGGGWGGRVICYTFSSHTTNWHTRPVDRSLTSSLLYKCYGSMQAICQTKLLPFDGCNIAT